MSAAGLQTLAVYVSPAFAARVNPVESGCWEWGRSRNYGAWTQNGRNARAHRVAYEALRGPIPDGLVLDHLCRNPPCVNPEHLEPVTTRENVLRGVGPAAIHARLTHCANGHPFSPENTRYYESTGRSRRCSTCHHTRSAAAWARIAATRALLPCGAPLTASSLRHSKGRARTCTKLAKVEGADGAMRCVQHDDMARGLPGRP